MRQRTVTDENGEHGATTRLTRAKAAALAVPDENATNIVTKKHLQSKKTNTTTTTTLGGNNGPVQRKRAALGDVSNVTKGEAVDSKEIKEVKKVVTAKQGLVSKAAQTSGVRKVSRTNSSRSILGAKDNNNKKATTTELKRPGSGSGVMGAVPKKRNISSSSSQLQQRKETPVSENEPPKKTFAVEVERRMSTEVKETVKIEDVEEPVADVKQAFKNAVDDLDAEDMEDPLMVAEYVIEIFEYLKSLEDKAMPNPDYMDYQDDLEWKMRGILVDWLIEVHTRFHLLPETLFLAVNIIDRFLSAKVVQLDRLQLVGVTAMFIASKYEEVLSPHVANFRHVADDGFTESEILSAERYVLSALDYDLSYPNPMNFLRRISKADQYDIQTRTLGKYLMEISLVDHRFMEHQPSLVAATAMYAARLILERGEWVCDLTNSRNFQSSSDFDRTRQSRTMPVTLRMRSCRCSGSWSTTCTDPSCMKHSSRSMQARSSSKVSSPV